ncbi:MAG: GtrA family protein [Rhodoferax sp.]
MSFLRLLVTKVKKTRAIRFVLVGVLNTTFGYLMYAVLLFVGLDYQLANLLALSMGVFFSFKTQGHLVFKNPNGRLLGRFVMMWALIYVCVITAIGQIMALGFNAYAAGAMVLPLSVVLSYLMQKYFVFRRPATGNSSLL